MGADGLGLVGRAWRVDTDGPGGDVGCAGEEKEELGLWLLCARHQTTLNQTNSQTKAPANKQLYMNGTICQQVRLEFNLEFICLSCC